MKNLILTVLVFGVISLAPAQQTDTYGWEGTATILSMYPADSAVVATLVTDPVHGGSQSLQLERLSESTPQAYVAWITGLVDGDEVTASFWRYDVTPAAPPSGRIWAHWNDSGDIDGYNGSAGGNSDYGPGTGWDETSHSWTVADGHTGLVIEARVYSNPGDIVWVDDMTVTAPSAATIIFPGDLALTGTTWGTIKTLF